MHTQKPRDAPKVMRVVSGGRVGPAVWLQSTGPNRHTALPVKVHKKCTSPVHPGALPVAAQRKVMASRGGGGHDPSVLREGLG